MKKTLLCKCGAAWALDKPMPVHCTECGRHLPTQLRNPRLDELALSSLGAYDAEEQTLP